MVEIEKFKLIKREIKRGRIYAYLEDEQGRKIRMGNDQYVWLRGNPSFKEIPPGYVIHHLDGNPINDDITNLVLFFKHHHTAYHYKNKFTEIPIIIEKKASIPDPTNKPEIRLERDGKDCWIYIRYRDESNKPKMLRLRKFDGIRIKTPEDAQKLIDYLWPEKPWELNLS